MEPQPNSIVRIRQIVFADSGDDGPWRAQVLLTDQLLSPERLRASDHVSDADLPEILSLLFDLSPAEPAVRPMPDRARRRLARGAKRKRDEALVKNEDCPICLERVQKRAKQITLGCGHMFHPKCILKWMRTGDTCPVCRQTAGESVP